MTLGVWLYIIAVILGVICSFPHVLMAGKEELALKNLLDWTSGAAPYTTLCGLFLLKWVIALFSILLSFASTFFLLQERESSPLDYLIWYFLQCCCCGGWTPLILIGMKLMNI